MSKEIYINPEEFYAEVDSLSTAKALITDNMFAVDKGNLLLDTAVEIETLIDDLNSLYISYRERIGQDVKNMDVIIAEWMNVDTSLAGKDLLEVIQGE